MKYSIRLMCTYNNYNSYSYQPSRLSLTLRDGICEKERSAQTTVQVTLYSVQLHVREPETSDERLKFLLCENLTDWVYSVPPSSGGCAPGLYRYF